MKKVLLFLDYYYYGGIEKIINDIKANMKENYDFTILTFVNKANDGTIVNLLKNDYRSFFKRNILGLPKLKKYLQNNSFDIIHIHCYNAFGLVYAKIARKYIKKVIIHGHNNQIDNDTLHVKHLINRIIQKALAKDGYIYLSCSKISGEFCFSRETTVIPNGIDYSIYKPNNEQREKYRKKYNLTENKVIGSVARFEEQKNHGFMIEIFKEVLKTDNSYRLVLVGEGSLLEKTKEKVQELQLNDKIVFIPYTKDVSNLINMFDIYLAPSIYEGFNITCVENQVNGKIVFASDRINKIVQISNNIKFISLDKTSKYWAKEILNAKIKDIKLDNKLNINKFIERISEIYEE